MSAPLPEALRARFQRLIEEGFSGRAAALRLQLSPATGPAPVVFRFLPQRCASTIRAQPTGWTPHPPTLRMLPWGKRNLAFASATAPRVFRDTGSGTLYACSLTWGIEAFF